MHKHDWKPYLDEAVVSFEKQKGQKGSERKILVSVKICKCEVALFVPHPSYGFRPIIDELKVV